MNSEERTEDEWISLSLSLTCFFFLHTFVLLRCFLVILVFQMLYIYANMVEVMKMFTGIQNAETESFSLAHMLLLLRN